jgi:hypothetical protein
MRAFTNVIKHERGRHSLVNSYVPLTKLITLSPMSNPAAMGQDPIVTSPSLAHPVHVSTTLHNRVPFPSKADSYDPMLSQLAVARQFDLSRSHGGSSGFVATEL